VPADIGHGVLAPICASKMVRAGPSGPVSSATCAASAVTRPKVSPAPGVAYSQRCPEWMPGSLPGGKGSQLDRRIRYRQWTSYERMPLAARPPGASKTGPAAPFRANFSETRTRLAETGQLGC
jgi:hypothetical protein